MRGNNNSKRFGMKFQVRWHESNWSMPISNLLEHNYSKINWFFTNKNCYFKKDLTTLCNQESENAICQVAHTKKIPSLKVMLPRFETIGPLGPLRFLLHSKKKREKVKKRLSTRKSSSWWKKFDPKTNKTSKNQVNKLPDDEKISR